MRFALLRIRYLPLHLLLNKMKTNIKQIKKLRFPIFTKKKKKCMNIRKVWTLLVFCFLYNRKWCNMADNSLSLPLFSVCWNRGHTLRISIYINESFYLLDQKKKQVKIKCEVNILSNKETKAERVVIQSQNNYSFRLGYGFFT